MSPTKISKASQDLTAVQSTIEAMAEPYRSIAMDLHRTIMAAGPKLKPRLWYGMPGYATGRSTPVLVFFRLDDGVMTLGLSEKARVEPEEGSTLKPCAWYLDEVDAATLTRVTHVVRTAFS